MLHIEQNNDTNPGSQSESSTSGFDVDLVPKMGYFVVRKFFPGRFCPESTCA